MVRALASHARGRGFESLYLYHITVLHCKAVSSYLQTKDDAICGTEHLTCSNGQRRCLCCCSMCRFPAMWVARCVCLPGGRCRFSLWYPAILHTVRCSERMPVGWCTACGDFCAFLFRRPDFTRFGVAFCLVTKPRRPFLRAIMRWKMWFRSSC